MAPQITLRRIHILGRQWVLVIPILFLCVFTTFVLYWETQCRSKLVFHRSTKYLWSTPRRGGFNNQLITIYEGIRCAQKLNRTLVLPLMYTNVRYDTQPKGVFPFEEYFDLRALSAVGNFVTLAELDRIGVPCRRIFHSEPLRTLPRLLGHYSRRYRLQLEYIPGLNPWTAARCIDDGVCNRTGLKAAGELGEYSNYDADGQGYSIRRSARLRAIRRAMQPSPAVADVVRSILGAIDGPFNAVHIRRGDYRHKCREMPRLCAKYGRQAFWQSAEWVVRKNAEFSDPSLPLFVSTTHPMECWKMLAKANISIVYMGSFMLPVTLTWTLNRTDITSYASQIVASKAREFVGNRFSSYTSSINYMRLLENMNETLRFF